MVLSPDAESASICEATTTIVDHAFNSFDLRTVYCEHISNALSPFACVSVAEEEGRFAEYVYHRDPDDRDAVVRHWDLVTTSIAASRWYGR